MVLLTGQVGLLDVLCCVGLLGKKISSMLVTSLVISLPPLSFWCLALFLFLPFFPLSCMHAKILF